MVDYGDKNMNSSRSAAASYANWAGANTDGSGLEGTFEQRSTDEQRQNSEPC